MNVKDLLQRWEQSGGGKIVHHKYTARLPVHDAARIAALVELYPLKSESEIIAELLSVVLDEVEAAFPYVQGGRVIAEDDMGDPIYEDVGQTPRFLALAKKHAELLAKSGGSND